MRSLSFIIAVLFCAAGFAQSPHGNIHLDCSACHQSDNWNELKQPMDFQHEETGFKMIGQHQQVDCRSCHTTLAFEKADPSCISCHSDVHQTSVGMNCESCHTPKTWVVTDIVSIHEMSRFPLAGAHLSADCIQCHSGFNALNFQPVGISCYDCHSDDYASAASPNHIQAGFSTECQDCHSISTNLWSAGNINHDFFPLIGGHQIANCFSCHQQGGDFTGLSTDCYSCHRDDFETAKNPNHIAEQFPTDCIQCHNINSFIPSTFNHANTQFPLTGKHIEVSCNSCHTSGYSNLPADCYSCHRDDYESTSDPNHLAEGYPTDCQQCHNTNDWDETNFDHALTEFPLTGAHISVSCASCHQSGYSNTPAECVSCHQQDFNNTTNPNHVAEGYPAECSVCHTTAAWQPSNFDHNNTRFPLTGSHIEEECSSCHSQGYTGTPIDCYSCHREDYENTDDPNHVAEGYPTDCQQCHNTNDWDETNFDHALTEFPLTGAHISVSCASCHQSGYSNTPAECVSCHQESYNNSVNPNHGAAGISSSCNECHSTSAWIPSSFNHAAAGFELTGDHLTIACSTCHQGTTSGLQNECISCHQENYNLAPDHSAQSYPVDCEMCHNTVEWNQTSFNHSSTAFPLTGAHLSTDCSGCHQSGFAGTPALCSECHTEDYNNSSNPSHTALALSTNCETCHSTDPGWAPAAFQNHDDFFELIGAHSAIKNECISCHNGDYNNTPVDCIGCHQTDYNSTSNPPHQTSGFSTDCLSCHTQSAWTPSTFDHDGQYFPIYSGKHQGEWNSCSDCHTVAANFSIFSCIDCHEHNRSETDNDHDEVNDYVYESTACLSCHPNGENRNVQRMKMEEF